MASTALNETSVRSDARPADEEPLYEIIDGQRVELPPMSAYATWIASRLSHRMGPYAEERALGYVVVEMLFLLDRERNLRRRPDIAFVSARKWSLNRELPASGDWDIVPDLAVEVVSPTDEFSDVVAKVREYFDCGVRCVWVVLPEERQVYVYDSPTLVRILAVTDSLAGEDHLPGFVLPLASLFTSAGTPQSP